MGGPSGVPGRSMGSLRGLWGSLGVPGGGPRGSLGVPEGSLGSLGRSLAVPGGSLGFRCWQHVQLVDMLEAKHGLELNGSKQNNDWAGIWDL